MNSRKINSTYVKNFGGDYWNACCNCGSKEGVSLHHVVPIKMGGQDVLTNLVPLCRNCHITIHHGVNVKTDIKRGVTWGGRPFARKDGLLSVTEVSKMLSLSTRTIQSAIKRGKLKATESGSAYFIRKEDVDAWRNNLWNREKNNS